MKIEEQVVSLKLAKMLKELDVESDSIWVWIEQSRTGSYVILPNKNRELLKDQRPSFFYFAYTVAELCEMLPDVYVSYRHCENWYCEYTLYTCAKKQADALAKMVIILRERGDI